jgi:hypothetical protein
MVNGLQIGMGLIELTKSSLRMHICLRSWMASSFQWLSMVNISRNTSQVCGMMDSKSRCYASGCTQEKGPICSVGPKKYFTQHTELAK